MATITDASAVGAGSLWNPNSWHWESRNYNTWAADTIRARLLSLTHTHTHGGVEVKCVDVPELKAEATVNIRKGKKIVLFDVSFKSKWEGRATDGSTPRVATADVCVQEVMQDDVDDKFEVKVNISSAAAAAGASGAAAAAAALDDKVREVLRTAGADSVRALVRAFAEALREHDGGLEKLALNAKRREEEAKLAEAARAEKGEEKERIAKEAAAREARMKEEAAARTAAAAAAAAAAPKPVAPTGTGSVWNAGSYHWEEKPLTGWAKDRLSELVKGYNIDVPGGHIKVVDVTLTGDASASIRKGKKLVFFDFKIHAKWEGELLDGDGNVLGTGDGELDIPELDQDNLDEYEVKIKEAEDGGASDRQLKVLFTKHGLAAFKERISQFVKELSARG